MSEEKRSGTRPETFTNMWSFLPMFAGQNKAMGSVTPLTKVQEHCLNMSKTWINYLWNMGAARRSVDRKKVWEALIESNKDLLNACQESIKKQAKARHELLQTFIPGTGKPTGAST